MFNDLRKTYRFERMYKENYARLYYYAFRFLEDEEACKDVVNDVFEKVWQQFEELKAETSSAFLYTQVRNRCIDRLRHQQVEEQYAILITFIINIHSTKKLGWKLSHALI